MLEKGRAASKREGRTRAADRPRWWAVLAVTLALMALVASVTTAAHRPHGKAPRGQRASAATTLPMPADGTATSTTTTTTGPGQGGSAAHSSSAVGDSPLAAVADSSSGTSPPADAKASQQSQSGPSSLTGTRTTTADAPSVAATTTTTTAGTTSAGVPTRSNDPGFLAYPGDISASYPVSAVGKVSATATWSGTPVLSLSITCPGRADQQTGTSGLSVTVDAATGAASSTCDVVIAEPQGTQATVSYTVAIVATAT